MAAHFPEPTFEELKTFATVEHVADWAELSHRPADGDAPSSPRGTLFAKLGITAANKPRIVAAVPMESYEKIVASWQVAGSEPNAALLASAGMFGAACRLAAGVTKPKAEVAKEMADYNARKLTEMEIQARLAEAAAPNATVSDPSLANRKVKMCTVVDQANDSEVHKLSKSAVDACYARYKVIYGDVPCPEEDVTQDQLAALSDLFKSDNVPYVDLAIWGPFGRRLQKKLQLSGMIIATDGSFQNIRLYGPPCIEDWLSGFSIFKTGAIMLDAVTHSTLDNYTKHIISFARIYGPRVWALIYQADVRARLEHLERLRRQGQREYEEAKAANGVHPFDPTRPWEWSFKALTQDYRFWKRELEDQAVLILAHIGKLEHSIEGDAEIEPMVPQGLGRAVHNGSMGASPSGHIDPPPKKKARNTPKHSERQHHVAENGHMTHNRNGAPLCGKFQSGNCRQSVRGNKCPVNTDEVHQCSMCLSQKHGSEHPRKCEDATSKPSKGGKGKGKGKGKGAGKFQR